MTKPVDTAPKPPIARRDERAVEQHGRSRIDPYAWLKDDNWREVMREPSRLRDDIRAYLDAENEWTRENLESVTADLQNALFEEMKGRIKEDDSSVPAIDGEWAYYRRFRDGGEYPLLCRRPSERAFETNADDEQLLLDGDELAVGLSHFDMRKAAHSPDHRYVAYAVDDKGSEFYTLRIRDVATGRDIDETIPDTYGEFVWGADSVSLYWVSRDENARPVAVHRRKLGSGADELVYRETDPGFFIGVQQSQSRRYIFITANDHTTTEWRYFRSDAHQPDPVLIAERERGVEYGVVEFDDRFWIRTNANGAVDFSVVSAPVDAPGRANWTVEIPHRPGVLILDIEPFADFLVRLERENGLPRIVVRARETGAEHAIAFEEAAYSLGVSAGYLWDTPLLRFEYSSPSTPAQVFDYHMADRTRVLRKTQQVPSGHNPADYVVERIDAPAGDGEQVPVTLLRRKDTPVDGSAPLLLYGYGAYGITIPADFRTARLSLVDRGFIYAVADVRGSMAKGYQWYLDGKLEKKGNSFGDFVAAGRHLVKLGYCEAGRVVGMGGSAGGMLMGASVNLDPELFGGMIAAVPFVDVLNTMSDETLPLTPPEWPEWGDPLRDVAAYDLIEGYSPYEQTSDKPYPPMLITGGLTDPRVTYWEPAKWTAKLRHAAPNGGPYFLRINMEAGHAGVSGRFASLRETALEYAFALAAVGKADGVKLR
ncbi:MAG: prolyl oligopeptidase family serine peptidase [Alphaproteobacteria bacterium]|nr:prolyl oligopeptidase family serine peptidase [Alphaproteobacteria bacterium]